MTRRLSYTWVFAGVAAGLIVGTAHVALAKFQCQPDALHGRSHSIAIAGSTVDGTSNPIPSDEVLNSLVVKTEFYDHPEVVHLDAFDPGSSPPVRKLHFTRIR